MIDVTSRDAIKLQLLLAAALKGIDITTDDSEDEDEPIVDDGV